ncbi:MAG: 4-coumarate--CoA ligase [Pseudomonadota bacterium]
MNVLHRAEPAPLSTAPRLGTLLKGRETALLRPLRGLIAAELGRQRGRPVPIEETTSWTEETIVDEHALGVDSLARLELVSLLNRIFHLHRTGLEDYLLVHRSLRDWCEIIAEGFRQLPQDEPERMSFETSGSTGTPKIVVHDLAELIAEAVTHPEVFEGTHRVVVLVPAHHIYGFLFSVVSPLLHDWPVLDLAHRAPGALAREGLAQDLVVGTPFVWNLVLRSQARLAPGLSGVSSTAPAPPTLWSDLGKAGLTRLIEIYGSTETLGIGWRSGPQDAFELLPHLAPAPERAAAIAVTRASKRALVAPDHVDRVEGNRFHLRGRRDGAVQVGGINVFPAHVQSILAKAPGVSEAAVRLDDKGAGARLKAFIVPDQDLDGVDHQALEHGLRVHASKHLSNPERPAVYRFGAALPRNAMGKLTDWPIDRESANVAPTEQG